MGPEVPVSEEAEGALQKSHRLLNQAKQLGNDVKGKDNMWLRYYINLQTEQIRRAFYCRDNMVLNEFQKPHEILYFLFQCKISGYVSILCLCVCVENGYSVVRLKGRVKAARDRTKDLLRAVNGTMETLIAIPNGTVQVHRACVWGMVVCAWERNKVKMDQYLCAQGSDAPVKPT